MAPKALAIDALLVAGVVCQLVCCFGVLLGRDVFDRLHYAGAGSTLGPVFLLTAIMVGHGFTTQGLETLAAVGLLFFVNPVLVTATARAARRLEVGEVGATAEERAEASP